VTAALRDVVICEPLRTPVGGYGGALRDVPAAELAERLAGFRQPAPRYENNSVMAKYARLVGSAAEGAVTTA